MKGKNMEKLYTAEENLPSGHCGHIYKVFF